MAEKIDAEALQFGQMLQRYRESAKVTQQEIADATGLTKNESISDYTLTNRLTGYMLNC